MIKAQTIYCFNDYIHSSPNYSMLYPRLDTLFKSLNKNPKPDMIVNSKALLAIILPTEYSYIILNKRRSHTATNSVQNRLDYSRFTQYCRIMHINSAHWMTLPHYSIHFTV